MAARATTGTQLGRTASGARHGHDEPCAYCWIRVLVLQSSCRPALLPISGWSRRPVYFPTCFLASSKALRNFSITPAAKGVFMKVEETLPSVTIPTHSGSDTSLRPPLGKLRTI